MLESCSKIMPPIKGCINAAMVLQDAIFENMTHAQWDLTIRSKVHTSWNLHRLLPGSIDFFILLSSLSGVYGSVAQSNYAAGCTFQDALARYRTTRRLKAISLDIGWMQNIGIIAETELYQRQRVNEANMGQISNVELLSLLDLYCDPTSNLGRSQLLIGAVTPAMLISQGQDAPISTQRPLFSGFTQVREQMGPSSSTQSEKESAAEQFRKTDVPEERVDIVVDALRAKLARALFASLDNVEPSKTLPDYGVDSLLAVELRNWILKDFQADVAVFDIVGGGNIAAIGNMGVEKSDVGKR
ncbi:hypothetical protein M426DRAFT_64177 [Hypoxylon sp. CI-4A]|nr:hypothetical protein M426DRAFT_64177 [Hypoxylon sp. CI-4A]